MKMRSSSGPGLIDPGGWEMITNGIFAFYIAGSSSEAAALGVILIAVAAISVVIINRLAAGRMGGVFG